MPSDMAECYGEFGRCERPFQCCRAQSPWVQAGQFQRISIRREQKSVLLEKQSYCGHPLPSPADHPSLATM